MRSTLSHTGICGWIACTCLTRIYNETGDYDEINSCLYCHGICVCVGGESDSMPASVSIYRNRSRRDVNLKWEWTSKISQMMCEFERNDGVVGNVRALLNHDKKRNCDHAKHSPNESKKCFRNDCPIESIKCMRQSGDGIARSPMLRRHIASQCAECIVCRSTTSIVHRPFQWNHQ